MTVELHVVGVEAGLVKQVVSSDSFKLVLRVRATGAEPIPLEKIAIRVDPLRDEARKEGDQPTADWNQRSAKLIPGEDQSFTISGALPAPGAYRSEVHLRLGDREWHTPLVVVREAPPAAAGIEVAVSTTKLVTRWCPSWLGDWCTPTPSLDATLRETDGKKKTLDLPSNITSASLKGAGDKKLHRDLARGVASRDAARRDIDLARAGHGCRPAWIAGRRARLCRALRGDGAPRAW